MSGEWQDISTAPRARRARKTANPLDAAPGGPTMTGQDDKIMAVMDPPLPRMALLDLAKSAVSRATYGPPENNFRRIAAGWSVILDHPVSAEQVALCMAWLKIARLSTTPAHLDSWVDMAGYAACGAEASGATEE